MTFWNSHKIEPMRKRAFKVSLGGDDKISFLAKTVNKPTLETDVNEYKLINQVKKFPSIPKWNEITIKYVDTKSQKITKKLMTLMMTSGNTPNSSWTADAITKGDVKLIIEQLDAGGKPSSTWSFKNPFIRSINFGDLDYSSDEFVEIDVVVSYDWAYLT